MPRPSPCPSSWSISSGAPRSASLHCRAGRCVNVRIAEPEPTGTQQFDALGCASTRAVGEIVGRVLDRAGSGIEPQTQPWPGNPVAALFDDDRPPRLRFTGCLVVADRIGTQHGACTAQLCISVELGDRALIALAADETIGLSVGRGSGRSKAPGASGRSSDRASGACLRPPSADRFVSLRPAQPRPGRWQARVPRRTPRRARSRARPDTRSQPTRGEASRVCTSRVPIRARAKQAGRSAGSADAKKTLETGKVGRRAPEPPRFPGNVGRIHYYRECERQACPDPAFDANPPRDLLSMRVPAAHEPAPTIAAGRCETRLWRSAGSKQRDTSLGLVPSSIRPRRATPVSGRYFRVSTQEGKSYVLMDAPPEKEDCRPFVHAAGVMTAAGLSVPAIVRAGLPRRVSAAVRSRRHDLPAGAREQHRTRRFTVTRRLHSCGFRPLAGPVYFRHTTANCCCAS